MISINRLCCFTRNFLTVPVLDKFLHVQLIINMLVIFTHSWFHFSDVFGPTIKSENIPGTPMESIDALLTSESMDIGSTSDSSLINDASHGTSNSKSQMSRRSSAKTSSNDGTDDKSQSMPNSNASSQFINNERMGQRPSITSTDGKQPSKQEVLQAVILLS